MCFGLSKHKLYVFHFVSMNSLKIFTEKHFLKRLTLTELRYLGENMRYFEKKLEFSESSYFNLLP